MPTLLEEYANRPGANLIFSRETSHLSSGQTQVTITAIVIEVTEQHSTRMQGIRVDLIGKDGTDRVYLDADGISAVLRDIRQLQRDKLMFPMDADSGHEFGIRGTARCAPSTVPAVHTLCPETFGFANRLESLYERRKRSGSHFPASSCRNWLTQ
ncbi:MAG: hypothetical protein HYR49_08905 [Gammaproteobacteria bacterium]|nr:hypothetical protein [Gammaproteobacteria bacterium]